MSERISAGELVAAFLEAAGVDTAFGVISIHNMPMLDAIGQRNRIRFVPARGEAGAVNMADAKRPGFGRARRRLHQHRDRGGQCLRRAGRGPDRGHAGPSSDGPDRNEISRSGARLYPRGARPADHAARSVQGGLQGQERIRPLRNAARGGARGAESARRPGQRRDTGRHSGILARQAGIDRAGRAVASGNRTERRSISWPMRWRLPSGRCFGSAAARAARRRRHARSRGSASAWSPAFMAGARFRKAIACRSGPTTSSRRSRPSTGVATRCWSSVPGCAATRRCSTS